MRTKTGKIRRLVVRNDYPNEEGIANFIASLTEEDSVQIIKRFPIEPCYAISRAAEAILKNHDSPAVLIDAVLQAFLDAGALRDVDCSYWVMHLNGFSELLWKRRLTAWIDKLYTTAFQHKTEDDDHHGYFLLCQFAELSRWDDRPEAFGITPENLGWMDWEGHEHTKERIDASPFPSEVAHIIWNLRHAKYYQCEYSCRNCWNMVSVDKVNASLARLNELGGDTSEFNGLLATLLKNQLREIQEEMAKATENRNRRLELALERTAAELATAFDASA